jgi:predicted acetyltransferase
VAAFTSPTIDLAGQVRDAARAPGSDSHGDYGAAIASLTDAELPGYVARLAADALADSPRPVGFVPSAHLWWADGAQYLGRLQIRLRLTPHLREVGGHIGYYVAPAHRRRGNATAMLRAALPIALELGIECALLTCDRDNVASRRVIEANGGLLQDSRAGKLRFWVPTG